ncbi:MAG: hypothetical protein ACTHOC_04195 [Luteimonas sp.]
MNEIRNRRLDVRAARRRADRKFESTPLSDALDDAILRLGRESAPTPPSEAPVQKPHAHRIAYAWQGAARELRASHPEIHALLSKRVLERLREEVLDDAADEIETLREHLRLREAAHAKLVHEFAAVSAKLAAANAEGAAAAAAAGANAVAAPAQAAATAGDPRVPGRALLEAVAAGTAALGDAHRDWCLAEAMVLTGFERTPVQLMEDGEAALAALVLRGKPGA